MLQIDYICTYYEPLEDPVSLKYLKFFVFSSAGVCLHGLIPSLLLMHVLENFFLFLLLSKLCAQRGA